MKKGIRELCKKGLVFIGALLLGALLFSVQGKAANAKAATQCGTRQQVEQELKKQEQVLKQLEGEISKQTEALKQVEKELKGRISFIVKQLKTLLKNQIEKLLTSLREKLQNVREEIARKLGWLKEEESHEDITESETSEDVDFEDFDVDFERYQAWNAGYNGTEYDFDKVPAEYLEEIKAAYEDGRNTYLLDQED